MIPAKALAGLLMISQIVVGRIGLAAGQNKPTPVPSSTPHRLKLSDIDRRSAAKWDRWEHSLLMAAWIALTFGTGSTDIHVSGGGRPPQ